VAKKKSRLPHQHQHQHQLPLLLPHQHLTLQLPLPLPPLPLPLRHLLPLPASKLQPTKERATSGGFFFGRSPLTVASTVAGRP
jgi:hypothetical protein